MLDQYEIRRSIESGERVRKNIHGVVRTASVPFMESGDWFVTSVVTLVKKWPHPGNSLTNIDYIVMRETDAKKIVKQPFS